jgi:hypothetical protein
MSDIKLFRLVKGHAAELQGDASDLEKSLQTMIENNLNPLLGIRFLASEHSTGKIHGGLKVWMDDFARRYPRSKIGEISSRIGQEVNRSQLKRALAELVGLSVVVMEGERSGARYRLAGEK